MKPSTRISLVSHLRFLVQCISIEEKASSFDFGQVTLHDFNSWREKPKARQQVISFQPVRDLQHSDMLAYFDNL